LRHLAKDRVDTLLYVRFRWRRLRHAKLRNKKKDDSDR